MHISPFLYWDCVYGLIPGLFAWISLDSFVSDLFIFIQMEKSITRKQTYQPCETQ